MTRALLPLLLLLPLTAVAQEGARALADEEKPPPPKPRVVTKPPKLLEFVDAPYPEAAKAQKLNAAVPLLLTISAGGTVVIAEVEGDEVGHGFDDAATDAALDFRFDPAHIDGEPAAIRIRFTYRFAFREEVVVAPPPETGRIRGRIRELGSRMYVAGATVGVAKAGLETIADAAGHFTLDGVPAGTYSVVATSPDHRRASREVKLAAGEEVTLELSLEPLISSPYEVVIKGERETTSLTRRTLHHEQLRSVPGTFGDPIRVVQNLPGVARAPYILGVLLIRGSSPGDSAVMVDGHEVPLLFHFAGGPSMLPPEVLNRIDFFPGNFTVRYGRAIGGIVDVETRVPDPNAWHGSIDMDLFDTAVFVEGPINEQTSMSAGLRRSYIDAVIQGADTFTDEDIAVVLPVYYDYQARADHRFTKDHRLALLVFGSEDALTVVGTPGQNTSGDDSIDLRIGFHRLKADWRAKLGDSVEWSLSPVVGLDKTVFNAGEVNADADVLEWALRWDVRAQLAKDLVLRTGIDSLGRYVTLTADIPLRIANYRPYPGSNPGDRETSSLSREIGLNAYGVYAESEWNIAGGPLTLITGVRGDHYRYFDEQRWFADPRANVRYALNDAWVLKAGAGIFSQAPPEWRLDEEFGNPDLELEWAEHYGVGVEWQFSEAISFDVQGFLNLRHDLAERADTPEVEGDGGGTESADVQFDRFQNIGEGRVYGVEFLARHEVTKAFYAWVAYTLSRSEQRLPGEDYEVTNFDQTHILNAVASYKFGAGWEAGLRFRLVSGNVTTPVVGSTFDGDWGQYRQLEGAENSARQPLFNQLDLRGEKTWFNRGWQISAFVDVQNVYNAENPEFTAYDYRFRTSAPVRGLPVFPSFGVKGKF